ncbi:Methyltransferase type 11 [Catenulispora acidiphila DSM 44928]|uniref:Methyltransferase type 11 n=1 Tax=Catenulispora acidiphila (strain DSM 44928 / JCM 14897 / NBRC 102108 / NRRL B-24433 / ID139908) TaxID=479433 RepID=C7QBD5_CATAD|nr:class I SAM-dependent methyltransferase [Catenulispora acidiphila]ACU70512.1 Methyltransferase type 11 [Catenulispora acidiphila DSM 44928]
MSGRIKHPVFARIYARYAGPSLEKAGIGVHRDRLLADLSGDVIEVGAGNGLNFPRYPHAVDRVVAVEPEPDLRALAERAARSAPVPVQVVEGRAEALPFPDGSFDAAVACLMLCSVADQGIALTEIARVLRPGGTLHFFEHVQAGTAGMRRVQRALDATVWPLFAGGCHTARDTAAAIAAAGFTVTELDCFEFPESRIPLPIQTHILGTATKPSAAPSPSSSPTRSSSP